MLSPALCVHNLRCLFMFSNIWTGKISCGNVRSIYLRAFNSFIKYRIQLIWAVEWFWEFWAVSVDVITYSFLTHGRPGFHLLRNHYAFRVFLARMNQPAWNRTPPFTRQTIHAILSNEYARYAVCYGVGFFVTSSTIPSTVVKASLRRIQENSLKFCHTSDFMAAMVTP